MFKFLKDKIKSAVSSFTDKVEKEVEIVETPVEVKEKKAEKIEKKVVERVEEKRAEKEKQHKEKFQEHKKVSEEKTSKPKKEKKVEKELELIEEEEPVKETVEKVKEKPVEKKGFFSKIAERVTTTKISSGKFDELFEDMEMALLENNVALEVIDKIKDDLKKDLVNVSLKRGNLAELIIESLRKSINDILNVPKIELMKEVENNKPYTILFLGFNGVGKSLSVARTAEYFKEHKKRVLLAAGDTFRAAAIAQLEEYAKGVNVPVVKHQQGSDACAVIFDAISSAKAKGYDVVLADTAGRAHSSSDLMKELQKIVSKNKPNLKVLVIEATVGSDVVEQVERFDEAVGVDALIITKNDVYEKGGSLLSAVYLLKKPILFLGYGQGYKDLKEYDYKEIVESILE